jgi:uncharacterized protein (DUF1501 family)
MLHRRHLLRLCGASALGAAIGAPLWRRLARAGDAPKATACILLYMEGGPSQLDTFDPKPGIDTVKTTLTGERFAAGLPQLAALAGELAVIRSIVGSEGSHPRARYLMHTGFTPAGGVEHPALGAQLAAERPGGELPGYVAVGGPGAPAGLLGAAHAPFAVLDPALPVRNLARADGVDAARFDERNRLRALLDDDFGAGRASAVADGQRQVVDQAIAMMQSPRAAAFDVAAEPDDVRTRYGGGGFGLGCLMARRLVEAGVPFVEVTQRGWDTHEDHAARIAELAPALDRGMAALLADLRDRGLLDSTLVVWTGDFGRTPWISARGGRDHYPRVTPAVLAGGGVRGGQIVGRTDERGHEIADGAVTVADLFRTIATALGLDPDRERISPAGRPIAAVDGGTVIPGVL